MNYNRWNSIEILYAEIERGKVGFLLFSFKSNENEIKLF